MCVCVSFAGGSSISKTVSATTTLPVGYYNYTVAYNQGSKNAGLVLTYNTSSTVAQVGSSFAYVLLVCSFVQHVHIQSAYLLESVASWQSHVA